ncbi:hypothetical protein [Clostridium guangxiense]|uniref:hypothetical protein n=1 Tax=Clostridium guangxiense TaxID=1662055 RepID=UPI001E544892|nr:hypothetical protein [Clostridium guangxiense]MCD2346243.1 hypothetical protein [Clostridium guangxiense]
MNDLSNQNYPKCTLCISRDQFLDNPEIVIESIKEQLKKDNNIRRMNFLIYMSDN